MEGLGGKHADWLAVTMLTGRVSSAEFLILSPYVRSPEIPFLEDEALWVGGGVCGFGFADVVRESLKRVEKQFSGRACRERCASGSQLMHQGPRARSGLEMRDGRAHSQV